MLPSPRIFRSRWAALLWAGGILWTAVEVASSAPHGGSDPTQVAPADLATLANALAD